MNKKGADSLNGQLRSDGSVCTIYKAKIVRISGMVREGNTNELSWKTFLPYAKRQWHHTDHS